MNRSYFRNNHFTFLVLIGILFLNSCEYLDPCYTKDAFMAHFHETIEEVKENGQGYSESDWEDMDKKVETIMDDCHEKYKDELTTKEKQKVIIYASTYIYERQKGKMSDIVVSIEDLKLDKKVKEFIAQTDDEIKDLFNEVLKDDFEKVVDSALGEFEKLAVELREKWEENKNN